MALRSGWPGGASPPRKVRTSSALSDPIRRPRTVIASKRRAVGPVHVLEHEHRRSRWRSRAPRSAGSGCRAAPPRRRAPPRAQVTRLRRDLGTGPADAGSRGRRRFRRARGHPASRSPQEPGHERGLADPRLAADEDDATGAARCRGARPGERRQRLIALEKLHVSTIEPARRPDRPRAPIRPRASPRGRARSCTARAEGARSRLPGLVAAA